MLNKKSQAVLEFIITYGWAFLVVLVAVGALAYFGVIGTSNWKNARTCEFEPDKCITQNQENVSPCFSGNHDYMFDYKAPFYIECQTLNGTLKGKCTLPHKEMCDFWYICKISTIDWKDTQKECRIKTEFDSGLEMNCDELEWNLYVHPIAINDFRELKDVWRLKKCSMSLR